MVPYTPLFHYRPNNTDLIRRCHPHPGANQQERLTCLVLNYLQVHDGPTSMDPAEFSANMEGQLERYDSIIFAHEAPAALVDLPTSTIKIQIGMIKKPILNNTSYCYLIECIAWCCDPSNHPLWLTNTDADATVIGTVVSIDWRMVPGNHDPAIVEECKKTNAQEAWRLLRYAAVRDFDEFGVRRKPEEDMYWLARLGRPREMAIAAVVSSRSGPLTTTQLEWNRESNVGFEVEKDKGSRDVHEESDLES